MPKARMTPGQTYRVQLDWFVRIGAILIICLNVAVMAGWVFDIDSLKSVLPGLATMKVNTALGFLACGIALWLVHVCAPESRWLRLARALSVLVAALGAFSLAEDLFDVDFGIDELILSDDPQPAATAHPGRMSPASGLSFFVAGLALFALKAPRRIAAACAHWLVAPPLFISTLASVGYAYGANSLYQVGLYTSMALHTALSFFVLSLCLLAADLHYGFARIATSDTAGGLISRRLLPTIPFALFFLGWIRLAGELKGLYGFEFGLALMVLMSITVCVVAVAGTATTLHNIDLIRQRGEAEINSLNNDLEMRVKERTQQLEQVSAKLSAANDALEQISLEDGLTGIANRRSFDADLAVHMAIAYRHKRPLALVMCDVDAFKDYNDHYGHPAGDECLRQIASALQSCCRRPNDLVARYGGEEFAIILPDTDLEGAVRIAELAREAIGQLRIPHAYSPVGPEVSISGGVAVLFRDCDMDTQQLIAVADRNLYEAKRQGRNRMVFEQDEVAETKLRLTN
jgi:diguanylate cyclase (GGDEF)-like protein